jgi:Ser/Thr protein kinase RdoA (MazF antagonist)
MKKYLSGGIVLDLRIKSIFDETVLKKAALIFGTGVENLNELKAFENFVYGYKKDNEKYILRITHSHHRSPEEVIGEIQWINYLYVNGASVSKAVKSLYKDYVEIIEMKDGSNFIIVSFRKAKGRPAYEIDLTDNHIKNWGKLIGKLHRLTKNYSPENATYKRREWYNENCFKFNNEMMKKIDPRVVKKSEKIIKIVKELPTDKDSYGLIHTDAHMGNFFIDDEELTLFDFDDSAYKHFISDIAIVLFYYIELLVKEEDKREITKKFLGTFLEGYYSEHNLGRKWFKELNTFLKLREVSLFNSVCTSEQLSDPESLAYKFAKKLEPRIMNDIPFVDIDYERI